MNIDETHSIDIVINSIYFERVYIKLVHDIPN